MRMKELKSFPVVQRALLASAVRYQHSHPGQQRDYLMSQPAEAGGRAGVLHLHQQQGGERGGDAVGQPHFPLSGAGGKQKLWSPG